MPFKITVLTVKIVLSFIKIFNFNIYLKCNLFRSWQSQLFKQIQCYLLLITIYTFDAQETFIIIIINVENIHYIFLETNTFIFQDSRISCRIVWFFFVTVIFPYWKNKLTQTFEQKCNFMHEIV